MDVRSDNALAGQLGSVQKGAVHPDAAAAVQAVIAHICGSSTGYRGGRELIRLLEKARVVAAEAQDWSVVAGVHSALGYAEGRILRPDFEAKYPYTHDSTKGQEDVEFIARMTWSSYLLAEEIVRKRLREEPELTAPELAAALRETAEDARLLDMPTDRPGRFRIVRGRSEQYAWICQVLESRVGIETIEDAAKHIVTSPEALEVLASDEHGDALLAAKRLQRRAATLARIRKVIEDPMATEHDLQTALRGQYWIFGGSYARESLRQMIKGDEYDIPLIKPDGGLYIVELKLSMGMKDKARHSLVTHHRDALIVANEVHKAVSQVMNYLLGLDEHRLEILEKHKVDTRRATGLVLIGHPDVHPEHSEEAINETLRLFNSFHSRIEVRTYKDLVDSAERALNLAEPD
jgi:Domain of unknown function (DUF4263)